MVAQHTNPLLTMPVSHIGIATWPSWSISNPAPCLRPGKAADGLCLCALAATSDSQEKSAFWLQTDSSAYCCYWGSKPVNREALSFCLPINVPFKQKKKKLKKKASNIEGLCYPYVRQPTYLTTRPRKKQPSLCCTKQDTKVLMTALQPGNLKTLTPGQTNTQGSQSLPILQMNMGCKSLPQGEIVNSAPIAA